MSKAAAQPFTLPSCELYSDSPNGLLDTIEDAPQASIIETVQNHRECERYKPGTTALVHGPHYGVLMSIRATLWYAARSVVRAMRTRRYGYKRLVEVRISRQRLLHNLAVCQRAYAPVTVAPVLKSNAYGHGLVLTARILAVAQPPFLVVESYYEALILRNEGIRTPIVVMGFTATENILRSRLPDVAYTLVNLHQLLILSKSLRRVQRFHLKVNIEMHRYGIHVSELPRALKELNASSIMQVEGVCSHIAKTTGSDIGVADAEIAAWNEIARTVRQSVPDIKYLHLASSVGSYWSKRIDANVIRMGLGAYGYDLNPNRSLPLQPALSMVSSIGAVRALAPGDGVGYGHTFIARRHMKVATIVSGYAAGIDIRLSNSGVMCVQGVACPVVGRVCMNATMIDVTDVPNVQVGDPVSIISANPEDPNALGHIAEIIGTSHHVVLAGIPAHLRRIVV